MELLVQPPNKESTVRLWWLKHLFLQPPSATDHCTHVLTPPSAPAFYNQAAAIAQRNNSCKTPNNKIMHIKNLEKRSNLAVHERQGKWRDRSRRCLVFNMSAWRHFRQVEKESSFGSVCGVMRDREMSGSARTHDDNSKVIEDWHSGAQCDLVWRGIECARSKRTRGNVREWSNNKLPKQHCGAGYEVDLAAFIFLSSLLVDQVGGCRSWQPMIISINTQLCNSTLPF